MTLFDRLKRLIRCLSGSRRGVMRVRDLVCCDPRRAGAYDWPMDVYREFRVARLILQNRVDKDDLA